MPIQIYSLEFAAHTSAIKSLCVENGIDIEIVNTSPMSGDHKTADFLKVVPFSQHPHVFSGSAHHDLQMTLQHY